MNTTTSSLTVTSTNARMIRDLRNREATARRERRTDDAQALAEYIVRAMAGTL